MAWLTTLSRVITVTSEGIRAFDTEGQQLVHLRPRAHVTTYPGLYLFDADGGSLRVGRANGQIAAVRAGVAHPINASAVSNEDIGRIFANAPSPWVGLVAYGAVSGALARRATPGRAENRPRAEAPAAPDAAEADSRHDWTDAWNVLPALPAEIRGQDEQPVGSRGNYHFTLRPEGVEERTAQVARASLARGATCRWEVWRVDGAGASTGAARRVPRGEGLSHEAAQSFEDWRTRDLRAYESESRSNAEAVARALLHGVAAVGRGLDLLWSGVSSSMGLDMDQDIGWRTPGQFLIRCTAHLLLPPHVQQREDSVAVKLVRVRGIGEMARAGLSQPEAQLLNTATELEMERAHLAALAPADRERYRARADQLEQQLQDQEVQARGSAVQVLEVAVRQLEAAEQREIVAITQATGGRAYEGQALLGIRAELERTRARLAVARERERGGAALRPRAHLVSRVDGHQYSLLLQLSMPSRVPDGGFSCRLSDVTSPTGHVWQGHGSTPVQAAWSAVGLLAGDQNEGYGDGTLAVQLPRVGPFAESTEPLVRQFDCYPRERRATLTRLEQLAAQLATLGLVMTGAGSVAVGVIGGVLGAAVAAERLARRLHEGVFLLDTEAVGDLLNVLAGFATGIQQVGRLRLIRGVAGPNGGRIGLAIRSLDDPSLVSRATGAVNEHVLSPASQIWADAGVFNELAAQMVGGGGDPESRQARLQLLRNAIQSHNILVQRHATAEPATEPRAAATAVGGERAEPTRPTSSDTAITESSSTTPTTAPTPASEAPHPPANTAEEEARRRRTAPDAPSDNGSSPASAVVAVSPGGTTTGGSPSGRDTLQAARRNPEREAQQVAAEARRTQARALAETLRTTTGRLEARSRQLSATKEEIYRLLSGVVQRVSPNLLGESRMQVIREILRPPWDDEPRLLPDWQRRQVERILQASDAAQLQQEHRRLSVELEQVRTEHEGITNQIHILTAPERARPREVYERMRRLSPDSDEAVLSHIAEELRRTASPEAPEGRDCLGEAANNVEPDHIVPLIEIVAMEGFIELPEEAQVQIANWVDNFAPLNKAANSSKSDRSWLIWEQWRSFTRHPDAEALHNDLIARTTRLRIEIQRQITTALGAHRRNQGN